MWKPDDLDSILKKVSTIFERIPRYGYWNLAILTMLVAGIIMAVVLYGIYRIRGWAVPTALLVAIGVITVVYRRKRFLSPSSVRLQTRLFLAIQRFRRVKDRDTWQMMRDAVKSRPWTGVVAAPVFTLLVFPVVNATIMRFWPGPSIAGAIDETVWVVHATVTGFSFLVLIFFWEFLGDEFDNEVFIRTAVRYTWSLHIIYFLLAANVVIGVLAVLAQGQKVTSYVLLQVVLFILSMFGVYWLYDTIYTVMIKETLTSSIKRRLDQQIGAILIEPEQDGWIEVVNSQLSHDYPRVSPPEFSGGYERVAARELGLTGEITDIHLHRLQDLFEEASALDVDIERLPALGRSYRGEDGVFVYRGNLTAQEENMLQNRLRRAVKVI